MAEEVKHPNCSYLPAVMSSVLGSRIPFHDMVLGPLKPSSIRVVLMTVFLFSFRSPKEDGTAVMTVEKGGESSTILLLCV